MAGCCEYGNRHLGSVKHREVCDWMNVNPVVVITYDHHVLGVKG